MAPRKEVRARQAAKGRRAAGREPVEATPATRRADGLRRRRRLFWMGVVGVAVVGIAFLGAFPARTYLRQQSATARAESDLRALDTEIDDLQTQIDDLQTDGAIEEQAREQYHMTRPGEEPIALLPAAPAPVEVPSGWPYSRLFAASR